MQVLFFWECKILAFDHEIPKPFVLILLYFQRKMWEISKQIGLNYLCWKTWLFYCFDQSVRKMYALCLTNKLQLLLVNKYILCLHSDIYQSLTIPSFCCSSNAATSSFAHSTFSGEGENALLTISTWLGWITCLPINKIELKYSVFQIWIHFILKCNWIKPVNYFFNPFTPMGANRNLY